MELRSQATLTGKDSAYRQIGHIIYVERMVMINGENYHTKSWRKLRWSQTLMCREEKEFPILH